MPSDPSQKPRLSSEYLRLFLSFQDDFMGYLFLLTGNREASLEVFQNAAVAILEHERLAEIDNFRAWSKEVLRRQALLYLRNEATRRKHCRILDPHLVDAVSDVFVKRSLPCEQRRALDACVQNLAAPQQRIVELRYGNGYSFDQIAAAVDSTAAAIQRSLSRIRGQLRNCVESRLAEERS